MNESTKSLPRRYAAIAADFKRYDFNPSDDAATTARKIEMRQATWLAWSVLLVENIEGEKNPARTQRPATLGTDGEVWRAVSNCRRMGERATKEDRELGRDLAAWRIDVLDQEGRAGSKLQSLLRAVHTFEHVGDCDAQMGQVKLFVFDQYGLRLVERIPEDAGKAMAQHHVKDFELLPQWVRSMTKPPGVFIPPARMKGTD